jgi:hypothetical protein
VLGLLLVAVHAQPALASDLAWGTSGTGNGQFGFLRGIAADASGNVYVADGRPCTLDSCPDTNDRVQKFSPNGAFLGIIGSHGTGDGQLRDPMGLAVDSGGNVYVVDFTNNRVQKFSPTGQYVTQWPSQAWDVAVNSSGHVLTAGNDGVLEFTAAGAPVRTISPDFASQVNVGPDDVVYALHGTGCQGCGTLAAYDSSGNPLGALITGGASAGQLNWPGAFTVAPDGEIFVVDMTSGADPEFWLKRFDATGHLLGELRLVNVQGTGFTRPSGIVASGDYLFMAGDLSQDGHHFGPPRVLRLDKARATADIAARPNPAYAGAPAALDARGSTALGPIVRYQWDLDGNGTFETDSGADATISHAFDAPPSEVVHVRVTSDNGAVDTDGVRVQVRTRPPAGIVGVSINGGDQFTNDPHVSLKPVWPAFTLRITASNDGGFANAQGFPVDESIPWTLNSSRPERLPKTIYARFDDSTQTFQDDIILDETAPTLTSAQIEPSSEARRLVVAKSGGRYVLRLHARDKVSGVAKVQWGRSKKHRGKWRRYHSKIELRSAHSVWVRVRDRARNRSKWRRAEL